MNNYLNLLRNQFNNKITIKEKRKGVYQLYAPFYHEDGDMYDIFMETSPETKEKIRICDHGLTLMRLSYSFDIDTPNKERIFEKILSENYLKEKNGNIHIDIEPNYLYHGILQFTQCIAKISNTSVYKREIIQSLFYELLDEFVIKKLNNYNPIRKFNPIYQRDDLEVDYKFDSESRPLFMFGVKDNAKARLVTISCLEFLRQKIPFRSVIIHEDFDSLSKKDRKIITNVVDKQFTDLDDFKTEGENYFQRELA